MKNNILKWGKLGPIFIYENIPVMPAQGLLDNVNNVWFKGGPIWPDWEDKPLVRHYANNTPSEKFQTVFLTQRISLYFYIILLYELIDIYVLEKTGG